MCSEHQQAGRAAVQATAEALVSTAAVCRIPSSVSVVGRTSRMAWSTRPVLGKNTAPVTTVAAGTSTIAVRRAAPVGVRPRRADRALEPWLDEALATYNVVYENTYRRSTGGSNFG
jgi:hypothetical protein